MITTIKGDMLANVTEGHILHGCNAQGRMGGGIALAIRNKWPQVFEKYREVYTSSGLIMGSVIPVQVSDKLVVWNCITQEFFGNDGRRYVSYDAVDKAMDAVGEHIFDFDVEEVVNFPLIGAGLGGGNWATIESIIDYQIEVEKNLWIL